MALAHQHHEGYYPGSIAYRHNNPGNLRWHPSHIFFGGVQTTTFTKFPTYELGFSALQADLKAKITGGSTKINYKTNPTFETYVRVYAPKEDRNDPKSYVQTLCKALKYYNVKPDTPLTVLAQLIRGEINRVPDPVAAEEPITPLTQQQKLNASENALKWADPDREQLLVRVIKRLRAILHRIS